MLPGWENFAVIWLAAAVVLALGGGVINAWLFLTR